MMSSSKLHRQFIAKLTENLLIVMEMFCSTTCASSAQYLRRRKGFARSTTSRGGERFHYKCWNRCFMSSAAMSTQTRLWSLIYNDIMTSWTAQCWQDKVNENRRKPAVDCSHRKASSLTRKFSSSASSPVEMNENFLFLICVGGNSLPTLLIFFFLHSHIFSSDDDDGFRAHFCCRTKNEKIMKLSSQTRLVANWVPLLWAPFKLIIKRRSKIMHSIDIVSWARTSLL